jgi:hypothetical protein
MAGVNEPHVGLVAEPAGVIVLVGGFLAPRGDAQTRGYWGEALQALAVPPGWRVVVAHPSPVASLHDRACQLFYQLKGGPTFYGHAHAAEHGHAAVDPGNGASGSGCGSGGLTGLHPAWSAAAPVHFVAHSLGGNTVRLLLQLMREGHECLRYDGSRPQGEDPLLPPADAAAAYPTSAWVRSVTCLCAPLNGGPAVYGLGGDPQGSALVRWGSGGFCLSAAIALVEGSKAVGLPWRRARAPPGHRCADERCDQGLDASSKPCFSSAASAPPAVDFGLAHFFQHGRSCDDGAGWLVRAARLASGLLRFALPWPLGASAAGKAQLEHGFAVFSTPDNLAYDVQVGAALAVNRRFAATALAAEAAAAATAAASGDDGGERRHCSLPLLDLTSSSSSSSSSSSRRRSSSGAHGDADEAAALVEDPHTFLFSVVGTHARAAACGADCPCNSISSRRAGWLSEATAARLCAAGAALASLVACLVACVATAAAALLSLGCVRPQHGRHCGGSAAQAPAPIPASTAAGIAAWWDALNVSSVAVVGWAMQCAYGHLQRGEPTLEAYPPDVRALVASFADCRDSAGGGPAAGPNGHDGVCSAKSQAFPTLGPGARRFASVNLNAATAAASTAAEASAAPPLPPPLPPPSWPRLEPGVWHYESLPTDHLGLLVAPRCPNAQRRFFHALFQRLFAIDGHLAAAAAAHPTNAHAPLLPAPLAWLDPPPPLPSPPPVAASTRVSAPSRRSELPAGRGPSPRAISPKGVEEAPTPALLLVGGCGLVK